jgi:uncharacterized repeat protein (TIGR02543 family)
MKTKNFGRKFTAFLAAVVITAGAITAGTVLLLQQNDKSTQTPAAALTPQSLMKDVADLQISHPHLFPSGSYSAPFSHYIEFGEYPQTHVADEDLIMNLNMYAVPTGHHYTGRSVEYGSYYWLLEFALNGEKYIGSNAHPYQYSALMSTGTRIDRDSRDVLWFRVEPLRWFVTNYDTVNAGVTTTMNLLAVNEVIAGWPFNNSSNIFGGYSSRYDSSDIRGFLNNFFVDGGSFLETAFNTTAQGLINPTPIDNRTDYVGGGTIPLTGIDSNDSNTTDKIYIPSYADMGTAPFSSSTNSDFRRMSRPTDFAVANYAYYNSNYNYNVGRYWLRSAYLSSSLPSTTNAVHFVNIDTLDYSSLNNSENMSFGLRPAMQISIPGLGSINSVDALKRIWGTYNYNLNGATGMVPTGGTVAGGTVITLPGAVSREGYTFAGWGVNNSVSANYGANATVEMNGNATIYAIWIPNYDFTYNLNGASGTPPGGGTVPSGTTINLSGTPDRTGYAFLGWGVNNSATATHGASTSFIITGPTTIYAIWTPINYEISYDLGGGSWISGYPASYNIENGVTLPTTDNITRSGYSAMRWHDSDTGAVVTSIPVGSIGVRAFYAEWGYTIADYNAAVAAKQAIINELNDVTIPGLNQDITNLTQEKKNLQELLDDTILEHNAEIEGLGDRIKCLEKKIESYKTDLADKIQELEKCEAERALEYEARYEEGYDTGYKAYVNEYAFVTWKILQGNESIGGPLTVYAQYGESVNTRYGTQIQELNLPTALQTVQSKQYTYTFSHWSLTPQVGETKNPEADFPKSPAAANVVYYAQYTRVERIYDIKWIVPVITGGNLSYNIPTKQEEITALKYGTVITTIPEAPELLYGDVIYIFAGWSTTPGGTKITNFGSVTGERTFYARYIAQPTGEGGVIIIIYAKTDIKHRQITTRCVI